MLNVCESVNLADYPELNPSYLQFRMPIELFHKELFAKMVTTLQVIMARPIPAVSNKVILHFKYHCTVHSRVVVHISFGLTPDPSCH